MCKKDQESKKSINSNGSENAINPIRLAALDIVKREMPVYQSHKTVWALQIRQIITDGQLAAIENRDSDGSAIIDPEEPGYSPFQVSREYMEKHKPCAGGYYVVYKDGSESFSPKEAFEEGNTRVQ